MPRSPPPELDEGDDELPDDEPEEEPKRSRSPPKSTRPPAVRRERPTPPRRWSEHGPKVDPLDDPSNRAYYRSGKRGKPPRLWRARDSLYFAPLVALAIIIILVVGVYAYTQNWPPVYVVESGSMQHGTADELGLLNTGDLVLAQKIAVSQIITYIVGMEDGYSTYGEHGDVVLYYPNGASGTPVIHRAIVYVDWIAANSTFSIPELQGLPCGSAPNAVYMTSNTFSGCGWSGLGPGTELTLYHIGWKSATVEIVLGSASTGTHSGFITMGDNNVDCSVSPCMGEADQGTAAISQIVSPGWVVGVARGMIPWVGAVKLLVEGKAGAVPAQSWQYLAITIVVLVGAAFAVHYAGRYVRPLDPRRAAERDAREAAAAEQAREEAKDEEEPEKETKGLWSRLTRRSSSKDEDDEADEPAPRHAAHVGRPKPAVRRKADREKPKKKDDTL